MKSAKRLIKPFIIYSLIGHVCFCVLNIVKGNISLGVFFPIKELLLVGSISGNLPLWFLLSLFGCRLIFNYALNKNVPVPLVAIVSLAFASLLHFTGYEYPLYVANISTGLFFMSLGYLITMRLTITPPLLAICLILWILAQLFPSFVSMRNNELTCGYYLLWMVYSLAAIISINAICQKFRRIFSCFEIVGRYSMEIYCIHWIPLMFL